ncbi:3-phenylpropionate/cinnamic acid dioxygenase small subunit [Actinocorallia herbida]|uniref:3-phenylpropionate/cinnamic acid dioxygenase small subunit n=1 Tax=Actinocorallia herbida TaxID=58109 RepID=A0A3N1D3A5_9ACTN|nr:aromatic-ring-hydroxylating dioxygenase subunit beta [Actinocorallia herbida]ROO88002.1 3-phenylpropionate/cinnamic acid dioxygenase small subunit [Actinocorallia herbida]
MTETIEKPTQAPPQDFGKRVSSGDPRYAEVVDWLHDEAALLDEGHTIAWTKLLSEDIVYRVPVRQTRLRDDTAPQFADNMFHYDENHTTLTMKILRLATTASPWCENPVSRSRRLITNIRLFEGSAPEEFTVVSSLLITRSRHSEPHPRLMSGARQDVLRRDGDGFLLAARTLYMDQSTVGFPNLTVIF